MESFYPIILNVGDIKIGGIETIGIKKYMRYKDRRNRNNRNEKNESEMCRLKKKEAVIKVMVILCKQI